MHATVELFKLIFYLRVVVAVVVAVVVVAVAVVVVAVGVAVVVVDSGVVDGVVVPEIVAAVLIEVVGALVVGIGVPVVAVVVAAVWERGVQQNLVVPQMHLLFWFVWGRLFGLYFVQLMSLCLQVRPSSGWKHLILRL